MWTRFVPIAAGKPPTNPILTPEPPGEILGAFLISTKAKSLVDSVRVGKKLTTL